MTVVLAFLVAAGLASARALDRLDPDLPSYLLLAGHLAAGRFGLAVSGMRSPLFCFLVAPLLALGVDGVVAARLVVLASGVLYLVGVWRLAPRFGLRGPWRAGVLGVAALTAAAATMGEVGPDLLVCGLLLLYLDRASAEDLRSSPRRAAQAGLAAGVAFLAKGFALPFCVLHFLGALALGRPGSRDAPGGTGGAPTRRVLAAAALAFALPVAPWILALSLHFGAPTISTMGRNARATWSPPEVFARNFKPSFDGLWVPEPGRRAFWEEPSPDAYATWSPLASRRNLLFQLAVFARGVMNGRRHLDEDDLLGLRLAALLGLMGLTLLPGAPGSRAARLVLWPVALYMAGYLPFMCWARRYFYLPITLLDLAAAALLVRLAARAPDPPRARALGLVALLLSLGALPAVRFARAAAHGERGRSYRALAGVLERLSLEGPMASTDPQRGWYVSYFSGDVFLGRPRAQTAEAYAAELRDAGARLLLVWGHRPLPVEPAQLVPLELAATLPAGSLPDLVEEVRVYRLRFPAGPPPAPGPVHHPMGDDWGAGRGGRTAVQVSGNPTP